MQQQPRKKSSKFGIGCLLIIVIVLCSAAVSLGKSLAGDTGSTPTPTDTVAFVSQVTSTPTLALTVKPTPAPTHKAIAQVQPTQPHLQPTQPPSRPTPARPICQAVNGNPWCYNFSPGNLIYNPPSNFCDYFNCITSFWQSTNGYVDECNDGMYSHSGGVQGACSRHGGEMRPLYSH